MGFWTGAIIKIPQAISHLKDHQAWKNLGMKIASLGFLCVFLDATTLPRDRIGWLVERQEDFLQKLSSDTEYRREVVTASAAASVLY